MLLVSVASAHAVPAVRNDVVLGAVDRVAVSGSRVAYADMTSSAGWDVFVRDGVAGRTVRVGGAGDQSSPDIDGAIVVFADFSRGDSDIRGYDVLERRSFRICSERGNQTRPRVSGDWVVWSELGIGSTGRLVALDLRTSEQVVIADRGAANAEIAGTTVVYEDRAGDTTAIKTFDLETKSARTIGSTNAENLMPSTDGTWVAWVTPGVDGYDIAYQRLAGGDAHIAQLPGEQTLPIVAAGTASFSERVSGSPVRTGSLDLATGRASFARATSDVVGFDTDGSGAAQIARGGADTWKLTARVPRATAFERAVSAIQAAWRTVRPARYLAWASDAPTFSASGAEQAAALLRPTIVSAIVSGPASVTISWESPRSLAGVKDFDVYRSPRPITPKTLASATRIARSVTGTGYVDTVKPSAETTIKASAYYYAVIARDNDGTLSPLSGSISADPHGAGMYTISGVESCSVCHSLHGSSENTQGALGALSADRCYDCHGSTAKTETRGAGSFFDTQARFRDDTTNTAGPVLASGGSIHRNATMVQRQRECTSCHDAHARPYAVDAKGRYDESASSSKLLRAQVGSSADRVTAWRDSDPAGVRICLTCHGATMTPITLAGGPAAYANSGGDHSGDGSRTYARSAHAAVAVTGSAAQVQCLVCHNQHGSATTRLIDYRQSNTTDPNANKQGNLCYRCHNTTTVNTWNARDVRTEFARTSRHPSVATTETGSASATCVSCHNTHFAQIGQGVWDSRRVSNPRDIGSGVSDMTSFCLGCHATAAENGAIGFTRVSATDRLVPYDIRLRASNLWPYFTGWGKAAEGAEFTKSGHATASESAGRAGCETCHDPHASDFSALTAWTRPAGADIAGGLTGERANSAVFADRSKEENLCYQCHGNGSAGSGKAAGAADVLTAAQSTYAHPVASSDAHSNKESQADLAAKRHAECVDCHDPHASRAGTHKRDSSTGGEVLRGAVGAKPTWASGNWGDVTSSTPKRILPGSGDDYEAYLCLKCHSTATAVGTSGSAGFRTNIAREFNPRNFSYHRVLGSASSGVRDEFSVIAAGSGTRFDVAWAFPARNVFAPGYDRDTKMTCSSCHGGSVGGASGPHGSSSKYLLDPAYPVDWDSTSAKLTNTSPGMPEGLVCSKCHSLTDGNGAWSNNVHATHAEKGGASAACRSCHVGVPHGWKRPRLLGYTTDAYPYNTWKNSTGTATSGDWGLTRVKVKSSTSPQAWVATDCEAGCHSVHSSAPRSYWP